MNLTANLARSYTASLLRSFPIPGLSDIGLPYNIQIVLALRIFDPQVDCEYFRWLHALYHSDMHRSWFFFRLHTMYAFHVWSSTFCASRIGDCCSSFYAVMLCCPFMIRNIPSFISSQDSGFFWSSTPSSVQGVRQIVCLWLVSPISVRNCFSPCMIFISHARTTTASCLCFASCATIIAQYSQ
jgi:hypothetical protein